MANRKPMIPIRATAGSPVDPQRPQSGRPARVCVRRPQTDAEHVVYNLAWDSYLVLPWNQRNARDCGIREAITPERARELVRLAYCDRERRRRVHMSTTDSMSRAARQSIGAVTRVNAEQRRKLEDLAASRVPLSWELVEDHGLFGLFRRPGPPPTTEEIRALLDS